MHLPSVIDSIIKVPISSFTHDTTSLRSVRGFIIRDAQLHPEEELAPTYIISAKLRNDPVKDETRLLEVSFSLAVDVFYDFLSIRKYTRAGKVKTHAKQYVRLFAIFIIHMTLAVTWYVLGWINRSGYMSIGAREGIIGQCMGDKNAYIEAIIGGLLAAVDTFVYKKPRAKSWIIGLNLLLVYHAVKIYMRAQQIGLLDVMPQPAGWITCDNLPWLTRLSQITVTSMLVKAALHYTLFVASSSTGEANSKRLLDLLINQYLAIFEDMYASH